MAMLLNLASIDHHDASSPLYGLPGDLMAALRDLGEDFESTYEPFYEDEPVQECGYSFENAVCLTQFLRWRSAVSTDFMVLINASIAIWRYDRFRVQSLRIVICALYPDAHSHTAW
jgi:hypothetical protein